MASTDSYPVTYELTFLSETKPTGEGGEVSHVATCLRWDSFGLVLEAPRAEAVPHADANVFGLLDAYLNMCVMGHSGTLPLASIESVAARVVR